jgi:PAS domain-containing protein
MLCTVTSIRLLEGETVKTEASDIKERVKAEPDLSLFRTLIENTRDPVYVLDPNDGFRMVYANQAVCLHFGLDREQLLAMHTRIGTPHSIWVISTCSGRTQAEQMHFETV